MVIFLGNLKLNEIEKRLGIELTEAERTKLNESRQDNAQEIASDKWHGYDMPLFIMCGSKKMAVKVREIFFKHESEMKEQVQIGWDK